MFNLLKIKFSISTTNHSLLFATGLSKYEHARWDRQIATDSEAGKLDFLIDEALAEHRAGKTKPL